MSIPVEAVAEKQALDARLLSTKCDGLTHGLRPLHKTDVSEATATSIRGRLVDMTRPHNVLGKYPLAAMDLLCGGLYSLLLTALVQFSKFMTHLRSIDQVHITLLPLSLNFCCSCYLRDFSFAPLSLFLFIL